MTEALEASVLTFFAFAFVVPARRALMRSTSDDLTYFETTNHAPTATAQTSSKRPRNPIVKPPPLRQTGQRAIECRRSAVFRKISAGSRWRQNGRRRSEEHTSELQSRF